MSIKKRGLAQGRGLSNLLGEVQKEKLHLAKTVDAHGEFTQLAIHQLQRGIYQPRGQILDDDVRELADSIKQHGIMQPLVVRRIDGANAQTPAYEIIAGERRWRAAKLAELSHVPVIIRDLDNQVAIALALIENIQRQDLNPIEQALALQRFHDEFNMSHQEIADTVGKARATVSNLLRLLSLDDKVKQMMIDGAIDMGHARALLALKAADQIKVAKTVVEKSLSVRQTEQLVRDYQQPKVEKEKVPFSADIERLHQVLGDHFHTSVKIDHHAKKGKGKVVISYHSLEELEGILVACGIDLQQL